MCLPAALASGKSCSQPLEATKLEAWAPGGTFKIPLSGWKIGIFFFFFWVCSQLRIASLFAPVPRDS